MKFTTIALSLSAFLLTGAGYADDCQNLYDEAVKVEQACAQYEQWINAEIAQGNRLIELFNTINYPTQRELQTKASVQAKLNILAATGPAELAKRCDKRWEVSAVLVATCNVKTTCESNSSGQFDLKIYNVDQSKAHVMHTYPQQYACIGRKAKIAAEVKKLLE